MWFLCDEDGTVEKASGAGKEFPKGSAIMFNGRRTFIVHINDGDHIKVTCMTHFGDLIENYNKLQWILKRIEEHPSIKAFSTHPVYGYVTTRIPEMGCGITVS